MLDPASWSIETGLMLFVASAAAIGVCGVLITGIAEELAHDSGLGQAIMGAVFLGATTSLSGTITSITAAAEGFAEIAVGNAIGGIAAQTTFLVIADLVYRRANLEHAAASETNLLQGVLLLVLLAIPLATMAGPDASFGSVHVASVAIVATYLFGLRLVAQSQTSPMWWPRRTPETKIEKRRRGRRRGRGQARRWLAFAALAGLVAAAGWVVAHAGIAITRHSGISESIVGTLFTAVSTSLPELVIAIAAVRRGALTLAVGNIIGGNTYDVLVLSMADVAYRDGSIYHAVTTMQAFWLSLSVLMTGVLVLGLLRRQKYGVANIGFESAIVLVLYLGAVAALVFSDAAGVPR